MSILANNSQTIETEKYATLSTAQMLTVINLIPDDSCFIDGRLCATRELIDSGKVASGRIIEMTGKSIGSDRGEFYGSSKICVPNYCRHLSHDDKDTCHSNVVKREDLDNSNRLQLILGEKMPCGIILNGAGANTHLGEALEIKDMLRHYVNKGYSLGLLEIGLGVCINDQWNKEGNRPNYLILESKAEIRIFSGTDNSNARITFNPKYFDRKYFESSVSQLEKIGFKMKEEKPVEVN